MKLKKVEHCEDYKFILTFANGERTNVDLKNLISSYVKPQETKTAMVNKDWGCLEFNNGKVDIEPTTLYQYVRKNSQQIH